MPLSAGTAADARNLAPREPFGAMAAVAASLNANRGIPASAVEDVLIGAVITEDALLKMPVYGEFRESAETYLRDNNVALRRFAEEHGIPLGIERRPGKTDPEVRLAKVTALLAEVQVPAESGFALNVAEVVESEDPEKMIKEIVRANKRVIEDCRKNLRKLKDHVVQLETMAERAAESSERTRRSTKKAKSKVRKIRRQADDPVVVEKEASSAESALDSGDESLRNNEDANQDLTGEVRQLRVAVRRTQQHMHDAATPTFQHEWMQAMRNLFPGLNENKLFEKGVFVKDPVDVVGKSDTDAPLDFTSVRPIKRMAEDRTESWMSRGKSTAMDTGGGRAGIYPVLANAWKALELLSERRDRGSKLFRDQVVTLAMALLYVDYAVAYAAKTATTVGDLGLKWTKNIFESLWDPDQGDMGAFANLKDMRAVRQWYKDPGVRALVLAETDLTLKNLKLFF